MDSTTTADLILELNITDSEIIAELEQFADEAERDEFAMKALKIGVLALKQARGQIDADMVRREGERLMVDLKNRLDQHEQLLNERMGSVLKEYFDPNDGRFSERVQKLLEEDGDLERTLKKQIVGDDSALSQTLSSHFGEESRLMKLLNPDQKEGLLSLMRETFDEQLDSQRRHVLMQFSLDDKESALSRLVAELKENHGQVSKDLGEKIDEVVKEFSLDEENSALSRLVKNVDEAQRTITKEFSLDDDKSSLARLQKTLTETLAQQQEANQKFQEEVKEALAAMKARKEEEQRSTRKGVTFENELFEVLKREAQRQGDIAEHTGKTSGTISRCLVGDVVIELSPDSSAAGAKFVIEAKEEQNYSLKKAHEEIEIARRNRMAQIGLFVFSRKTAPAGLEPIARYGDDVFVIWDAEAEESDLYLKVGYTLAKALCVKGSALTADQQADFEAIEKAINEIIKQTDGLTEIETWSTTIKNNSDKIIKKVETSRKKLKKQIEALQENTDALRDAMGE